MNEIIKRHYDKAKIVCQHALLVFKVGENYEMYHDDAVKASRVLGLPMQTVDSDATRVVSFPCESLQVSLGKLIKAGHRAAVCDNLADMTDDTVISTIDGDKLALAADAYGNSMVDREIARHKKNCPERLAKVTADELQRYRESWVEIGAALANDIFSKSDNFIKRVEQGLLHPSNATSRKLFTDVTGVSLPKTVKGTQAAVAGYCGEQIAAYRAALHAEHQRQEAQRLAAENAKQAVIIAGIETRIIAGDFVSGDELVQIARHLEIEIHPRTVGTLRKRVVQVKAEQARITGRGYAPSSIYELYREVADTLKATDEPPEACDPEVERLFNRTL